MSFFVSAPVACLYNQPSRLSPIVSQALYGWKVKSIASSVNGFLPVRMADGYEGWVEEKELVPVFSSSYPKLKLIHNQNHLYAQPDLTKQRPILTLPFEVVLPVVSEPEKENKRWIQVQLLDQSLAWIQRGDVSFHHTPLNLLAIQELSQQFLGLPYTWGGASSFGYDCSGFIQMLFRQMGVFLPRDAKQQIQESCFETIEQDIKKGDVIFLGTASHSIIHLGLYLGDHRIIHATAHEKPILQITDLNDARFNARYPYRSIKRLIHSCEQPSCSSDLLSVLH